MFAVRMITIDRSPKRNFVKGTLDALERSSVFSSPLLESFYVFDSGSPSLDFLAQVSLGKINSAKRNPVQNVVAALRSGAAAGSPWVLFLEDDIDVCGDFLESIAGWLADHEDEYPVFPLGANYDVLKTLQKLNKTAWKYPVAQFYGTLAVVMRAEIAYILAAYLETRDKSNLEIGSYPYDLYMGAWATECGYPHFLTPVPSFVQHTGTESVIRPGSEFHTYATWPGPSWTYQRVYA